MYDQEDHQTHYRTDEFIYGDQILVCPILEPNAKGRRMYIPRGKWYNFWNDEVVDGGKEKWVDSEIDIMPLFIKEGAIIPKYPIQQYVGEKTIERVILDVYYKKGKEVSQLYDDAHDGYDYTKGRYSLRTFKLTGKSSELIINQHKEGKFNAEYNEFEIRFHGLPFKITQVEIDNVEINMDTVKTNGSSSLIVDKNFVELHLFGK